MLYMSPVADLGKAFTLKGYRKCYICPEPDFQCEFNGDVRLVIGLTKYGNFSKFICSGTVFQADFNYDSHYVIWRVYCNNI